MAVETSVVDDVLDAIFECYIACVAGGGRGVEVRFSVPNTSRPEHHAARKERQDSLRKGGDGGGGDWIWFAHSK